MQYIDAKCLRAGMLLFLISLSSAIQLGAVSTHRVGIVGTTDSGHQPIEVTFACEEVLGEDVPETSFGYAMLPELCVISSAKIIIGETQVYFPKRAYRDLASPDWPETFSVLEDQKGAITVLFDGGDGESSYKVRFFIGSARVLEKREVEAFDVEGDWMTRTYWFVEPGCDIQKSEQR